MEPFTVPDLNAQGYSFSQDWFTQHIPNWQAYVTPSLKDEPIACLEIGCFEGLSTVWQLQHLCTHAEARLHCVDPWPDPLVCKRFNQNILHSGFSKKVRRYRSTGLTMLRRTSQSFDFIYIDGDHRAKAVLTDLVLCWDRLRPMGIMVLDDYLWQFPTPAERESDLPPGPAIDAFLKLWAGEFVLIDKGWQVILQRSG